MLITTKDSDILKAVSKIRELQAAQEMLNIQLEAFRNVLKDYMTATKCDTLIGPDFKCTWKSVVTTSLDQKALKAEHPNLVAQYMKHSSTLRFCLK